MGRVSSQAVTVSHQVIRRRFCDHHNSSVLAGTLQGRLLVPLWFLASDFLKKSQIKVKFPRIVRLLPAQDTHNPFF